MKISDAFARRSVIKAFVADDDADVSESVKKDERSEFVFVFAVNATEFCQSVRALDLSKENPASWKTLQTSPEQS
jgi:hypothetical protein